jgi:hypothetical protein
MDQISSQNDAKGDIPRLAVYQRFETEITVDGVRERCSKYTIEMMASGDQNCG